MVTYLTVFTALNKSSLMALKAILLTLSRNTPLEPACSRYKVYRHSTNPLVSYIIETWESEKDFQGYQKLVVRNKYVEQALSFTAAPFESIKLIELLT